MRILIIGGTRFIGPPVVARLSDLGHDVTVFHRGQTEVSLPAAVRHLHGDRAGLAAFAGDFRAFAPDVVLDMGAFTEHDAQTVVLAFEGTARRLVVLSSQDVYRAYDRFHNNVAGALEPVPFGEDAPLRERLYPYRGNGRGLDDYEKILVERAAAANPALPATILRLPMVYGERDYQHRIFVELKRMDDARPAMLLEESFARWRWTRAYVENVAHAVVLAVTDERAAGRVYNVGEPEALTYAGWLRAIAAAAGWPGTIVTVPDGSLPAALQPPRGEYQQHLIASTLRIRRELGYLEPVARDEALRRTVQWERTHRPAGDARWFDYAAEDAVLAELHARPPAPAPSPFAPRLGDGPPPEPVAPASGEARSPFDPPSSS